MTKAHFIGELFVRADFTSGPMLSYELQTPFGFHSADYDVTITVPAGFTTDFGSVPRMLEWSVSGESSHLAPGSVIHDYLYRNCGVIPEGVFSRLEADKMLVESMALLGAGWYKRNKVFTAVRLGGKFTWKSK